MNLTNVETAIRNRDTKIADLQAEVSRLKEFARYIIQTECWGGGHIDGPDVQELAVKLGLIEPIKATESDVDEESDYEVGDTIYKFTEVLKENEK